MPEIILSDRQLERRRLAIQSMFRTLAKSNRVEVFFKYGVTTTVIGLGKEDFGLNFRRARHPSRLNNVFLNYFEVWVAQKGGARFVLERAYFHVDIPYPDGTGDEEVLALHCDPIIPSSEEAYIYKRGPHLHISSNKRNISKAHIALCLTSLDQTCQDYESFSSAFSAILVMIDDELLPRLH